MKKKIGLIALVLGFGLTPRPAQAAGLIDRLLNSDSGNIDVLILLSIITLLPSILIMMTSFTRIIIVLSFLRNAMGLQQSPPNQVLVGIALFLTMFIMSPVLSDIHAEAYLPYDAGEISGTEAVLRAEGPLKEFMLKQTKDEDLALFLSLADMDMPAQEMDLPMTVVVPSFMTSELR